MATLTHDNIQNIEDGETPFYTSDESTPQQESSSASGSAPKTNAASISNLLAFSTPSPNSIAPLGVDSQVTVTTRGSQAAHYGWFVFGGF